MHLKEPSFLSRQWGDPQFTPNSDQMLIDKIVTDMSSAPPEVGIDAAEANVNFENNEIIKVLKEVKAPITCINAGATNVETNKRHAPSFKVKIMSGVGHFHMIEDPETFNRLLEETIQEFLQMAELK
jgi:pimeloyl-ACP methyl ester carboxylesterase